LSSFCETPMSWSERLVEKGEERRLTRWRGMRGAACKSDLYQAMSSLEEES
jgi:hypothetical protein